MQDRAHRWIAGIKQDGLERRLFSPSAMFQENYSPPIGFPQASTTAVFLVDNQEFARNTFTCQIQQELQNQIGAYDPNKKY